MTASSEQPAPKPTWGPEARTTASLLLFAHLFAVVVAVTSYTQPSLLQQRLHELFVPYLRNLHLAAYPTSYPFARYHLTHALVSDVDFTCQVEFEMPDGTPHTVTLPATGLQPPVRYRRYQLLTNAAGTLAGDELNEDAGSILPKTIGGSILKRHGASQGVLRLRGHLLPEIEDMASVESGDRQPLENYSNVYEAQVIVAAGRVEILKRTTTLESAPVENTTPLPPSRPGAPSERPE